MSSVLLMFHASLFIEVAPSLGVSISSLGLCNINTVEFLSHVYFKKSVINSTKLINLD